ncbi:unnamed protein product [Allacma fusca]|uniref:Uncharacterized protein n=1 Tax=Allacma fusca TaxID=39272 RepID=A0A8J2KIS8_9HEXA|nr:unnamed protein product [Allacma fusca]
MTNMNAIAEYFLSLTKSLSSKALGRSETFGNRKQSYIPALYRKIPKRNLAPWKTQKLSSRGFIKIRILAVGTCKYYQCYPDFPRIHIGVTCSNLARAAFSALMCEIKQFKDNVTRR